MPLTTVDPTPALIVVDLQKGIAGRAAPGVIARNVSLVEAFRAKGHTVVLVNVSGGAPGRTDQNPEGGAREIPAEAAELIPELGATEDDLLITKRTWGAFHGTGLHEQLQERGVTQVFVTGVATSIGVETTARAAFEHGYHVVAVTDAMSDVTPEGHEASVSTIFPRLSQTASTDEVLARI